MKPEKEKEYAENNYPEIKLPFDKNEDDPGEWTYDHRVGLCITVIAYLVFAIIFVTGKIIINDKQPVQGFYIDLQDLPIDISQDEQMQQQMISAQGQAYDFSDVRNARSNENASETGEGIRNNRSAELDRINDQADNLQKQLDANREAYERGLAEEQAIINGSGSRGNGSAGSSGTGASGTESGRTGTKGVKSGDVKVQGRVTVSFSLSNPIRNSVYLHIPAYQCEGGGEVRVNIAVNRKGDVTGASVAQSTTSDRCVLDMALEAARRSRFNIDTSAPDRHAGYIDYIFIPQ